MPVDPSVYVHVGCRWCCNQWFPRWSSKTRERERSRMKRGDPEREKRRRDGLSLCCGKEITSASGKSGNQGSTCSLSLCLPLSYSVESEESAADGTSPPAHVLM